MSEKETTSEKTTINYEFEKMFKRFQKQVQKEGIIREIRNRRYYMKPSEKRRMRLKKNRKRR